MAIALEARYQLRRRPALPRFPLRDDNEVERYMELVVFAVLGWDWIFNVVTC